MLPHSVDTISNPLTMIYALTVATALAATASTTTASHAIRGSIVSHGASGSHKVRSAVVTDDHALKSKIAERVKGSRFSGGVQQLYEKAKEAKAAGKISSRTASHSVTATTYNTGSAQELYYEGSDTSCSSPGILTCNSPELFSIRSVSHADITLLSDVYFHSVCTWLLLRSGFRDVLQAIVRVRSGVLYLDYARIR
jgi:hypothetical protein